MALAISLTDQTGRRLAEVSRAFQSSLSGHGIDGTQSTEDSARLLSFRDTESDPRHILRDSNNRMSPGTAHPSFNDDDPRTLRDVREPAYLNLLSELQRFCQVSSVDVFDGETAIDLLWPSTRTDQEIGDRICDVIESVESQSTGFKCEYQLTVWAASPVRSAFLDAALRAVTIESQVQNQRSRLSPVPIRLSSSGQVWNNRKTIRPAVTVVIRRLQ
jgi:hypothetical protein